MPHRQEELDADRVVDKPYYAHHNCSFTILKRVGSRRLQVAVGKGEEKATRLEILRVRDHMAKPLFIITSR